MLPFEEMGEEVGSGLSSYLTKEKSSLLFQRQQLPRLLHFLPKAAATTSPSFSTKVSSKLAEVTSLWSLGTVLR